MRVFRALETEFGPDRFQAFWTSPLPVPDAFHSAFGVPVERWVMGFGRSHLGSLNRGPEVHPGTMLLSLLTLGILFGGALHVGRRRI